MIKIELKGADEVSRYMTIYKKETKRNIQEVIKKATYRVTKGAKEKLTSNGSVDTGRLRSSIVSKVTSMQGISGSNVKYAKAIEEGSPPHIIRAKNKKYLYWAGASHPVKQVNHPGSKAKPYLIPAYEKELPRYMEDLSKAIEPK